MTLKRQEKVLWDLKNDFKMLKSFNETQINPSKCERIKIKAKTSTVGPLLPGRFREFEKKPNEP